MYGIAQAPQMARVERIKISGFALKKLRLRLAMTQQEFGNQIGVKIARMGQYESSDEVGIYAKTLRGLAALMRVSPDEALSQLAPRTPKIDQSIGDPVRRGIPLINKAPAGTVTDYHECSMVDSGQGHWYISRGEIADPHAFAVHVTGDSMMPTLKQGDIAVFSPMAPEGHTLHGRTPIPDGHVCFIRFGPDAPSEGCTIARIHRKKSTVELRKDNKKHRPIVCDMAHIMNAAALVRTIRDELPGATKLFFANDQLESPGAAEGQVHPDY